MIRPERRQQLHWYAARAVLPDIKLEIVSCVSVCQPSMTPVLFVLLRHLPFRFPLCIEPQPRICGSWNNWRPQRMILEPQRRCHKFQVMLPSSAPESSLASFSKFSRCVLYIGNHYFFHDLWCEKFSNRHFFPCDGVKFLTKKGVV